MGELSSILAPAELTYVTLSSALCRPIDGSQQVRCLLCAAFIEVRGIHVACCKMPELLADSRMSGGSNPKPKTS